MALLDRNQLLALLNDKVRSGGDRGKTTAEDMREFLLALIDALLVLDTEPLRTPQISLDSIDEEMLTPELRAKLSAQVAATLTQALSGTHIAAWGDSLTSGLDQVSYTVALAKRTGFSFYNGGIGGQTSVQIKDRMLADTAKYDWPTLIWAGHNDSNDPNQVLASIAQMVAALGHPNYLVLSLLNATDSGQGTLGYQRTKTVNDALAARYAERYLDVRAFLVQQGTQDEITRDVVPLTLHRSGDTLHLNTAGYNLVADYVQTHLEPLLNADMTKLLSVRAALSLLDEPTLRGKVTQLGRDERQNLLELRAPNGRMVSFAGTGDSINTSGNFYLNGGTALAFQVGGTTAIEMNPGAIYPKLQIVSPKLVGTPTAPTAAAGDNSTQVATTAFVQKVLGGQTTGTGTSTPHPADVLTQPIIDALQNISGGAGYENPGSLYPRWKEGYWNRRSLVWNAAEFDQLVKSNGLEAGMMYYIYQHPAAQFLTFWVIDVAVLHPIGVKVSLGRGGVNGSQDLCNVRLVKGEDGIFQILVSEFNSSGPAYSFRATGDNRNASNPDAVVLTPVPAGVFTKINTFPTLTRNSGGGYDAAQSRYTVPVTGTYEVKGQIEFQPTGDKSNAVFYLIVYVNGIRRVDIGITGCSASGEYYGLSGPAEIDVVAGDYVELYTWHSAPGGSLVCASFRNSFSIRKITV